VVAREGRIFGRPVNRQAATEPEKLFPNLNEK